MARWTFRLSTMAWTRSTSGGIQASTWPRKSTRFTMVRPRYGAVNASPVAGWKAPKMYPFPRRP